MFTPLGKEKIPQDKALTGFIETNEIAGSGT